MIRDRVQAGALAAGRSPAEIRLVLGAVTVVDRDGAAARRRARAEVVRYLAVVADLDPTTELPDGAHVAGQARRVLGAGAGRIDFGAPHGLGDAEGVALLGTAVLPRLR